MKDEVGMAGSKSIQTRFVGIITSTMHPYVCFLRGAKTTNNVSHIQIKSANKQVRYVIIKKSKRRDV